MRIRNGLTESAVSATAPCPTIQPKGREETALSKIRPQHIGEPKESEGKLSGPLRDQTRVNPVITKQRQDEKKNPSEDLEADND